MKSQLHYLSASHCAAPVTFGSQLPVMCTVCAVLPISLTKVKQLRTSTLGCEIATPTELPGVRTVCAVLPISLTKVKQLRTSTLGYVIAPPTDLLGVRTVCTVLPVPLSGVKSLFTLLGRLGVNSCIGLCYFHGLSSVNGGALKILGDGQLKSGHSFGSFSQNP